MGPAKGGLYTDRWEEGSKGHSFLIKKWTFSALRGLSICQNLCFSVLCCSLFPVHISMLPWVAFPSMLFAEFSIPCQSSVLLPHLLECVFQTKIIFIVVFFFSLLLPVYTIHHVSVYHCPLVTHQISSPGEFHCSDPFSEVLNSVKVSIVMENVAVF